ncbi:DoxX family protein [Tsukamurella soli]|uniref:Oxidoreductase n=1 Tax=Tsukamurella soli TaxID=644556 RepID=A0ABP8K6L0_9ACTN
MSDNRSDKATSADPPATRDSAGSPMDRPTGELPRFGDTSEIGDRTGRILDPHDDSDTGIGPALPRYRDDPASGSFVARPADPPIGSSSVPDTSPGLSFGDYAGPTEAIPAPSAPTGPTVPIPADSAQRDQFGRLNNRRRGRERAAAARAEAEGLTVPIDAHGNPAESDVPRGRRFSGPTGADELEAARRASKRGTTDVGLLVLRVALGVILVGHGAQHLFGLWGGPGLGGFQKFLANSGPDGDPTLGFHHYVEVLAVANGVVELVGGVMLVVGVLTPIAASGALGAMIVAALYKLTLGGTGFEFFAAKSGIELELMLGCAAVGVLLAGPGRLSLDYGRGWARRPHAGSVAWLLAGIAGGVVIWIVFNGADPLVKH